jgi:hypothetical protein
MAHLLSIKTVFPRRGARVWYDDQREAHRQIYGGDDVVDYAFMGTDPTSADNRWLREAMERQIPFIYFLGVSPGRYQPIIPTFIVEWHPERLQVQLAFGMIVGASAQAALPAAPERRYALREVKARLHQTSEGWPAGRFLAALAEHEIAERGRRRLERHLTEARLPPGKTLDTFDFEAVPVVSKAQVMALAAGGAWLNNHDGNPGSRHWHDRQVALSAKGHREAAGSTIPSSFGASVSMRDFPSARAAAARYRSHRHGRGRAVSLIYAGEKYIGVS